MSLSNVTNQIKKFKTLTEKPDLKGYGKEFQVKVIKLIISDRSFAFKILPILKKDYFSDTYVGGIFEITKRYLEKYNRTPSIDNLNVMAEDTFEMPKPFQLILKSLENIDLEDREFIIENINSFCFKKHAESELDKISSYITQGKFDTAQTLAYDLFKFNTNNSTKIYSLKNDYQMIFDENKVINPQPLPFDTFNKNMQGGPGAGKLVIAVAGSNFGKTNYLVAQARKLNEQGKKVVLFTFEIGGSEIFRRHVAGLTETKQSEISTVKSKAESKILSDEFGDFVLVEEKATKAKMSTIVHNLNYLKSQGFFPDAILVDSLNQLKLPEGMKYEGDNRMFEYLAEELRDLSKDEMVPVTTVFQGNRAAFKAEVNDEQNIGKAIEPLQVADVLMFFSQTPHMRERGVCNVNLIKNRLGPKGLLLECKYDPDLCTFEEIGLINPLTLLTDEQAKNLGANAKVGLNKIKEKREQERLTIGKI